MQNLESDEEDATTVVDARCSCCHNIAAKECCNDMCGR